MSDKMLYNILEVKYLKMFEREITLDPNANDDLYPNGWASSDNYELKSRILIEALKDKKKIEETELYQSSFIEGTRKSI